MAVKVSKTKRNNKMTNRLVKSGKIKKTSKKKKVFNKQPVIQTPAVVESESEESDHGEGMLQMVEDDDISFLKQSVIDQSYSIFKNIRVAMNNENQHRKPKRKIMNDENLEDEYEKQAGLITKDTKKIRTLLPIKTKEGLTSRFMEINDEEEDTGNEDNQDEEVEADSSDKESIFDIEDLNEIENDAPITPVKLLSLHEKSMSQQQLKIAGLCAEVLETPEVKTGNLRVIIKMFENFENGFIVRKLAALSLVEVFDDILPSYEIKEHDMSVKLKKDTLQLYKYEEALCSVYKSFLQKLEKISNALLKNHNNAAEDNKKLAEVAVSCFCKLLIKHSYFNYAKNIAQVVVRFSNHKIKSIREEVRDTMKEIFKDDRKGEISVIILRNINIITKQKSGNMRPEILESFLTLRLRDVNLDQKKEENLKEKKMKSKKHMILSMSKKEKKRKKKLQALEQEMLETKAEESASERQKNLTEVTKILFTIYFRVLKQSESNNKLLTVTLQGLAKFAYCINVEFFSDLINVLDGLLEENKLGFREHLYCVQTAFTILTGQGDILNIDLLRFYIYFYKILLALPKHKDDFANIIDTLNMVLIKRKKKVNNERLLAFSKRVMTISLHMPHAKTLACLGIVKSILHGSKTAEILLDCDNSAGDGRYLPFLDEPDNCCASSTAFWELTMLQNHYHPTISQMARKIAITIDPTAKQSSLPPEIWRMSAEDLYTKFDSSLMAFYPPILPPKKCNPNEKNIRHLISSDLKKYCKNILKNKV